MPESEKKPAAAFDDNLLGLSGDAALAAVTKAGSGAEALVAAWVKAGNAAAVNEVAEHGAGGVRKAARRGINVRPATGARLKNLK